MTASEAHPAITASDRANVLWFLPTPGDVSQIARAADDLGYQGVLLTIGRSCEDSWVVASGLVAIREDAMRELLGVNANVPIDIPSASRASRCAGARCGPTPMAGASLSAMAP